MREIEAWDTSRYLVVPHGGHRLDARAYKRRYSAPIKVRTPRGSRARVEQVIAVDGRSSTRFRGNVFLTAFGYDCGRVRHAVDRRSGGAGQPAISFGLIIQQRGEAFCECDCGQCCENVTGGALGASPQAQ